MFVHKKIVHEPSALLLLTRAEVYLRNLQLLENQKKQQKSSNSIDKPKIGLRSVENIVLNIKNQIPAENSSIIKTMLLIPKHQSIAILFDESF